MKHSKTVQGIHEAVAERNLDIALDATGAKLDRRFKIETEQGVREITHKELLMLISRRAAIETALQEGRKPPYKKCAAASCILLIPIKKYGSATKWCRTHKQQKRREGNRSYREKNREKLLKKEREKARNYYEKNCQKLREVARDRSRINHGKNKEKNLESMRIYREKNREKLRKAAREYAARKRAEKASKKAAKSATLPKDP